MSGLSRDAVADLLLQHRLHFAYGVEAACNCGAAVLVPGMGGELEDPLWTTHQADVIMTLLRPENEVKAEALDEAAAMMPTGWTNQQAWLQGRATRLRSGGAS